ncbi:ACP S-malonyltransferase [Streptomyces sp. NPDC053431]|uniref:ACP S-malonyltransferase n=1 Tax=Streptomyces sp. NPDC053431 TaxID=3365703 RepID=UPI0037D1F5F0
MSPATALVFPGMGPSNFAEVGKFMVLDPYVRRRLAEADEALGYRLLDRFYASADDYSEYTQLAFLVNSTALADRAVETLGMRPEICVGPSFGQKAAAVYAETMTFSDAIRMTAETARCEAEFFAAEYTDTVTQSVARTPREPLEELVARLREHDDTCEISGYMDSNFFLVTLRETTLDEFTAAVRALGGHPMYTMRPPVHARAFAGLRAKAEREVFARYRVGAPALAVVADQDGRVVTTADDMRTMLLDTFDRPVDWPAAVEGLSALGVERVVVTGPDNLFRRLPCTTSRFEVTAFEPKGTVRAMTAPVSH